MSEISEDNYTESLEAMESTSKIKEILDDIENKKNEILNICAFIANKNQKKSIRYIFEDFSLQMDDVLVDIAYKHKNIIEEYESEIATKWEQSLISDYYKSVL